LLLQDRDYVTVKSRVLSPEFRGRMVSFGVEVLNLLFHIVHDFIHDEVVNLGCVWPDFLRLCLVKLSYKLADS
jgi:hypothetical protein